MVIRRTQPVPRMFSRPAQKAPRSDVLTKRAPEPEIEPSPKRAKIVSETLASVSYSPLSPSPVNRTLSVSELTGETDPAHDSDSDAEDDQVVTYADSEPIPIAEPEVTEAQRSWSASDFIQVMAGNQMANPELALDDLLVNTEPTQAPLKNHLAKFSFRMPNSCLRRLTKFRSSEPETESKFESETHATHLNPFAGYCESLGNGEYKLNMKRFLAAKWIQDKLEENGLSPMHPLMLKVASYSDVADCEFFQGLEQFPAIRSDYLWQVSDLDLSDDDSARSASCDLCLVPFWKLANIIKVLRPATLNETLPLDQVNVDSEFEDLISDRRTLSRNSMFVCCNGCFRAKFASCSACSSSKALDRVLPLDCNHCHPLL